MRTQTAMKLAPTILRLSIVAVLSLLATATASAQDTEAGTDRWTRAENAIVRLPPAAFTQMPDPLVTHLARIGCSIPQTYISEAPHNVIKGQFQHPDQIDWAVLCHRGGITRLLVFWQGAPDRWEELQRSDDHGWLQTIDGEGTIGYSHFIGTVGADYILEHYEHYGGTTPPEPLDHEGINNAFTEKASTVFYWHDGRWLTLSGAD